MEGTFQRLRSDAASNWQHDYNYYPETKLHNRRQNSDIFSKWKYLTTFHKKIIIVIIAITLIIILGIYQSNTQPSGKVFKTSRRVQIKPFKGPTNDRQKAVVRALQHSWKGYKKYAWGHDNLKPISKSHHDVFGLGLTIIDSIDTIFIMDLQEEYEEARQWIDKSLRFDIDRDVNLFEVTIRVLGGLLSIYHLTDDEIYLKKAVDLGNRLMPCFDSPSSIPFSDVNLGKMRAHAEAPERYISEITSIQLEFRDLSRITNNKSFEEAAFNVSKKIHELHKIDGLVPMVVEADTEEFREYSMMTAGARSDSYYEYLLKQWLQTGKKMDDFLIKDYIEAVEGFHKHMRKVTPKNHHVFLGQLMNGNVASVMTKMDHLVCYLPGTLLLGYKNGMHKSHMALAVELLETCYQTYIKQPTKLAPEIVSFSMYGENDNEINVSPGESHNLLRPEFVESLYYFWITTGNTKYQDMGWEIFEAFEKHSKVDHGYTSIGDVTSDENSQPRDMMESFWMAETLKYLYLLFTEDSEIDLNKFIFNTEAHLIPIRSY